MKKLIFGLLLLSVTNVWADRITSGPIGLILPSTGVVSGRPPGDKLNFNFEVIAASMAGIISGNPPIAGGVGVNVISIYDEGANQGNINTLNVTGSQAQISVVGATGTLNVTAQTNTQVFYEEGSPLSGGNVTTVNLVGTNVTASQSGSTATVTVTGSAGGSDNLGSHMSTRPLSMQNFGIAQSTGLEVGGIQYTFHNSTSDLLSERNNVKFSTITTQFDAVRVSTQQIANTPATVAIYDEGAIQAGDGTTLNFTGALIGATCSGSTCTVNVSNPGGSIGISSTSHRFTQNVSTIVFLGTLVSSIQYQNALATVTLLNPYDVHQDTTLADAMFRFPRGYDLYIGSYGTKGVDMYVDTLEQWNMALGSVGARGLTWSTTAQARIYSHNQKAVMGSGVIPGGIIPAGITVVGGASSTWVDGSNLATGRFLDIYGKIYNMILSIDNIGSSIPKITLSSGSKLIDSAIIGAGPIAGAIVNSHSVRIQGNDIEVLNLKMPDPSPVAGVTMYGDACPLKIIHSSNVVLDFENWHGRDTGALNSATNMQVSFSTRVTISGNFNNMKSNGINFAEGNVDSGISARPNGRDTIFEYSNSAPGDVATIFMGDNSGTTTGTSSTTFVKNTQFIYRSAGASNAIKVNNGAGRDTTGFTIKNVTVTCYTNATAITAINLGAGSLNTVIDNVDVYGCTTALTDGGRNTNKAGLRLNAVTQ